MGRWSGPIPEDVLRTLRRCWAEAGLAELDPGVECMWSKDGLVVATFPPGLAMVNAWSPFSHGLRVRVRSALLETQSSLGCRPLPVEYLHEPRDSYTLSEVREYLGDLADHLGRLEGT
jgi:hypothetical protein